MARGQNVVPADLPEKPLSFFAQKNPEEVLKLFEVTAKGLSVADAEKRLRSFGKNIIAEEKKGGWIRELLGNFKDPLVIILLFASILSFSVGEVADAGLVAMVILLSVGLNFLQEHRANTAVKKLQERVATLATVRRGGKEIELPIAQIVPGDVLILNAGNLIPADAVVLQAKDFFVNQSSLTGESFPAEKTMGALEKVESLGDMRNIVFCGSSVVSGSAMAVVIRTGAATEYGHIAAKLSVAPAENDFIRGVRRFSFLILRTTIVFVLFIFFFNTFFRHDVLESFLFAVAVAVGLTPELLPMIMSITMASGSLKMAQKGVIVKKLSAIPSFGSMNILCTDKTGTLTEDSIRLIKCLDTTGQDSERVLLYAYLNSIHQTNIKNPLDEAVVKFHHCDISGYERLDEIPFDFVRKRMSVVVGTKGKRLMLMKGAPEEVLKVCTTIWHEGGKKEELSAALKKKAWAEYEALSKDGYRVLAVAFHDDLPTKSVYEKEDEVDLTLAGFIAFLDPPKKGVGEVLRTLEDLGIEIKIITGDNELVTRKICQEVGLPIKGVLLGQDIDALTDDALRVVVERTTIFARFSPDEKNRIIHALRANGHVVGYSGDGINDAPSFRAADVSISVSNAVDVAKEAADIVLTHKSLHELKDGVLEGRKIFGNTMKYVLMGISSNFGNMFSVLGAVLFIPFLPMLPIQILLNNFLYDISQITIPTDNVDEEYIRRPKKWDIRFIRNFMLTFGPVSSIFDFLTFFVLYSAFSGTPAAFRTGWFLESLATQTLVIYIIRTRQSPFWKSWPSRGVIIMTLSVIVFAWLLPITPFAGYLGLTPLPLHILFFLCGVIILYLLCAEGAKWFFYRHFDRASEQAVSSKR